MGTTADKLNKLLNTKQEIKQAIVDKGVEVGDDTKFSDYPAKINAIQTGDTESVWEIVTDNWTRFQHLFHNCTSLTTLDVSNWDTSNVKNMANMFSYCQSLTSLDVSKWNTSNVTTMSQMFYNCNKLTSLDASNFDTTNVTNMDYMFQYCSQLTTIGDLSNWNTSKVTSIYNIFQGCSSLTSLDLSNWDISKVTGSYNLTNGFDAGPALVDFYPPKNISANMSVSKSTALSHDSLMRIINNLITTTSTKTLTLGATNLAKLTADEVAIATGKGWTVA